MTMLTSTTDVSGITPDQYGALIVQPVQAASVAFQVSALIATSSTRFQVPIITADPSAAWVVEGGTISESDATLDELTITPTKVAGITPITSELASDASPDAARIVGQGLARDIATTVDSAYFGNLIAPAQAGLESLTTQNDVVAGTTWANLDAFAEAIADAEQKGAMVSSFVANPADALILAQLKDETGSNRPLLGIDPTVPTRRLIYGVPLLVSSAVTVGTVWGIPRDRSLLVLRNDTTIEVDRSVYFATDRIAVRAILRIGFGFPHEAAIQKVKLTVV